MKIYSILSECSITHELFVMVYIGNEIPHRLDFSYYIAHVEFDLDEVMKHFNNLECLIVIGFYEITASGDIKLGLSFLKEVTTYRAFKELKARIGTVPESQSLNFVADLALTHLSSEDYEYFLREYMS